MQRRDFFSLMPFLGAIPKPKMQTDFEQFVQFIKTLELPLSLIEIKKLWEDKESVYVLLFRLIVKQENVQLFYLTEDRIRSLLWPLALSKRYRAFLNKTNIGYVLTVFDNNKLKGAIQFIKL